MPIAPSTTSTYSATVSLQLDCLGRTFRLSHVAPGWVIPKDPVEIPPCDAELIVTIDDDVRRELVRLPAGMKAEGGRTPYEVLK